MRTQFWIKCTGLHNYKSNYFDQYYQCLTQADSDHLLDYPNRHFAQIDKDIDRTYPDDPFFTDDVKKSLRRVFRAYTFRNPTVGYYQGMNYLIFRVRKILSEEDTFWMMCLIIESYLPPDFYVDMYGAQTHATILVRIFQQYGYVPNVL